MENKTLFGELPLGWKHVALSDVTTFISRGRQPKYIASVEGIPVINQKMIRNFTIDYRYVKYNDPKKNINKSVFIKIGDTLVNSTGVGTVGRSAYISIDPMRPTFVDSHVTIVRPDTAIVDPKFMSVVLSSDVYSNYMGSTLAQGSTGQVELSRQKLSKMCIPFPPLNTQHLIGTIFDLIDQKIKLNHQINKNLLQMMETKWRKQFEGLDANQGHFTDLADVVAGGTPSKKQSEYFGGNIAWITPKDMSKTTRVFIEHGTLNITKIGLNNSSAKLIPKGTILFSSRAPIGYIGIAANPVSTNQGFKSLVPKRKEFTEYLYFLLKRLTPLIENIASGSTFKEISGAGMKSVDFPLPTSDMIEAFHHEARSLFDLIKCNEKQSQYLNFIRNLILPKLLAGEINISFIEEAIKNA